MATSLFLGYKTPYMEKIILGINADQLDIHAINFACYIARLSQSRLTGVFLDDVTEEEVPAGQLLYGAQQYEMLMARTIPDKIEMEKQREENIRTFNEICAARKVHNYVHRGRGIPADDMIEESRFADLMILDAKTTFSKKEQISPSHFVRTVLTESECPVIIAPEGFDEISEIVFAYDGSKSSVFAIKQFTYLFPEMDDVKTTVLQVNKPDDWAIEERSKISEWLKPHYSSIGFHVLHGNVDTVLLGYLEGKKNVMVVMGAYGRSWTSTLFRPSSADPIVRAVNLPLFIAHY
jgi:nucleotide-binding universal stress UspA family protein